MSDADKYKSKEREIQEVVDDLLDKGEFSKIPRFSKYLKRELRYI
jgi:hypothetical protein